MTHYIHAKSDPERKMTYREVKGMASLVHQDDAVEVGACCTRNYFQTAVLILGLSYVSGTDPPADGQAGLSRAESFPSGKGPMWGKMMAGEGTFQA